MGSLSVEETSPKKSDVVKVFAVVFVVPVVVVLVEVSWNAAVESEYSS